MECETCVRRFASESAVIQHMNALDHWAPRYECDTCSREFRTARAADQHMDQLGHWSPRYECDTCNLDFPTEKAANRHMEDLNHRRYCHDCARMFPNPNALRMHLNSSIHRGKNVACPFCKAAFVSATGLSHHLETSSCTKAKSVNHRTIYEAISQRDPNRILTNDRLLTYPDPNNSTQNIATKAAWNGSSFECYLCHREYSTLRALGQHLNSPAHSEKLYHCPNRNCKSQFARLASLFNHLESETCNFVRFERVQENVRGLITGRHRLLGFA